MYPTIIIVKNESDILDNPP
jgi:hypothetical protein